MEFDGIILSHSRSSNVLVLTLVLGKYLQIDIFFTPEISLILSSERAFLERYEHDILRKHTNVFPRNTGGYEIQLYFKFRVDHLATGVGCMLSCFSRVQLCVTLWSGSSVHGILHGILEWIVMPSSRVSSQPRDRTCISYIYLHWQAGPLPVV